jgi:hypothetical protein
MNVIGWDLVPEKYRKWTTDYDNSASMQSYKQLKHSAKYIINKLKTTNINEDLSTTNIKTNSIAINDVSIDKNNENKLKEIKPLQVILGVNGEIYHISETKIQVFDWLPNLCNKSENVLLSDKSLYLIHSIKQPILFKTVQTFPLHFNRVNKNTKILYILETSYGYDLYYKDLLKNVETYIPFPLNKDVEYFSVPVDSNDYFILYEKVTGLLYVFDYENLSLVSKFHVEIDNDVPVFDIRGHYLIFSANSSSKSQIDKKSLSQVNLSTKNSLINKLIKTFSNTAVDSMFLFSEISQNKINKLMESTGSIDNENELNIDNTNKNGNGNEIENEKIKNNYRDIFIELYNTISKSSSYIQAYDLSSSTSKPLFQLSIPTGCGKISLSPFDLQFLTISHRGDDIFLWDFTNAEDSIILIDKYTRGKTSAVIESINWGYGNSSILCLSKQNGSLHYFINESLRNYEDLQIRKKKKKKDKLSVVNNFKSNNKSWCLSNLKLKNFQIIRPIFIKDFIVGITEKNDLLQIDIETGNINGFIDFFVLTDYDNDEVGPAIMNDHTDQLVMDLTNKEIEVETCKPYLPAYNNRNYKFLEINPIELNFQILSDLDSSIIINKEFNIAGTLYERRNVGSSSEEQSTSGQISPITPASPQVIEETPKTPISPIITLCID